MSANASSPPTTERRRCRLPAALVAALVLSACAAPSTTMLPDLADWEVRRETLASLDAWAFNGRIAVRTTEDGFNGKLRYRQAAGDFEAIMSGPLGIGTVMLERDDGRLTFTDKEGVETVFVDPERELELRFGWDVPLDSLRYWALGIPDPARPAETTLDGSGQLASMMQDGWDIAVNRYREAGGQPMPQRLTVTNDVTRVILVIDRWDIPGPR
jgi:outer membrane lipoprotein LolB